eukprot:5902699-Prymnesium_polylepis.2
MPVRSVAAPQPLSCRGSDMRAAIPPTHARARTLARCCALALCCPTGPNLLSAARRVLICPPRS